MPSDFNTFIPKSDQKLAADHFSEFPYRHQGSTEWMFKFVCWLKNLDGEYQPDMLLTAVKTVTKVVALFGMILLTPFCIGLSLLNSYKDAGENIENILTRLRKLENEERQAIIETLGVEKNGIYIPSVHLKPLQNEMMAFFEEIKSPIFQYNGTFIAFQIYGNSQKKRIATIEKVDQEWKFKNFANCYSFYCNRNLICIKRILEGKGKYEKLTFNLLKSNVWSESLQADESHENSEDMISPYLHKHIQLHDYVPLNACLKHELEPNYFHSFECRHLVFNHTNQKVKIDFYRNIFINDKFITSFGEKAINEQPNCELIFYNLKNKPNKVSIICRQPFEKTTFLSNNNFRVNIYEENKIEYISHYIEKNLSMQILHDNILGAAFLNLKPSLTEYIFNDVCAFTVLNYTSYAISFNLRRQLCIEDNVMAMRKFKEIESHFIAYCLENNPSQIIIENNNLESNERICLHYKISENGYRLINETNQETKLIELSEEIVKSRGFSGNKTFLKNEIEDIDHYISNKNEMQILLSEIGIEKLSRATKPLRCFDCNKSKFSILNLTDHEIEIDSHRNVFINEKFVIDFSVGNYEILAYSLEKYPNRVYFKFINADRDSGIETRFFKLTSDIKISSIEEINLKNESLCVLSKEILASADLKQNPTLTHFDCSDCVLTVVNHTPYKIHFTENRHLFIEDVRVTPHFSPFTVDDCQLIAYCSKGCPEFIILEQKDIDSPHPGARFYVRIEPLNADNPYSSSIRISKMFYSDDDDDSQIQGFFEKMAAYEFQQLIERVNLIIVGHTDERSTLSTVPKDIWNYFRMTSYQNFQKDYPVQKNIFDLVETYSHGRGSKKKNRLNTYD